MANTVIALKKSATASAVPADLANGELAINYADGKLYYKHANGTIAVFSSGSDSFGTVNANSTLVIADTSGDILTLAPGNNISIVGDAVNDKITIGLKDSPIFYGDTTVRGGGKFIAGAVGGDEGGEILLEKPPNGNLDGGITIDAYQDKIRIFEQGGSARGVYINLASAAAGVGTDLLASSGTTDTTARSWAAAAFAKANTANITADLAFDKANSIISISNTAPTNTSLWFHSELGKLFINYIDSNSTQWIDTTRGQFFPISIDVTSDLRTINTNANVLSTDSFILANGTITLTLPATSTVSGRQYKIKNIGTGDVTIVPQTGEEVDGKANVIIGEQYSALTLLSTGTTWHIF